MTWQLDSTTRDTQIGTLNTNIGASALIKIYTGSPPANCAASDSGTLLSTLTGNASGFGTHTGGVLTLNAVTSDPSAAATGTAGHFRICDSGGTVHAQGTITETGGGGDITINTTSIVAGDVVACTGTNTITQGGA